MGVIGGYLLGGCRNSGPSKSSDFDPFVGCETAEYRLSARCVRNLARLALAPGLCTCVNLWGLVLVISSSDDVTGGMESFFRSAQRF